MATELIQWLTTAALASGIVTYLAKVLIDRLADSGVEAFKADLKRQHELELERTRADLGRMIEEHRIRFASLHARRAEVIGELYRRLARTQQTFALLVSLTELAGEPDKQQKLDLAASEARELVQFFRENRLYLDESIVGDFGRMEGKLRSIWADFVLYRPWDHTGSPVSQSQGLDVWRKAHDVMSSEVPGILTAIEGRMRLLLEGSVTALPSQPTRVEGE